MIIDRLANSHLYSAIFPVIRRGFDYLQNTDLHSIEPGRYEIDGKNIFALVQKYSTKEKPQGTWEAHRLYIDLQYIVQGMEQICYAPISRLSQGSYDPAHDFLPLSGTGDFLRLVGGDFMLLFPEDGHMPGIIADSSSLVKKVVVKMAVSLCV